MCGNQPDESSAAPSFVPAARNSSPKDTCSAKKTYRLLETEGMKQVWVTELEVGEIGEDEAVTQVATKMGCGCLEIRLAAGGRANLVATEDCCVLVDDELLKQINCAASIAIATSANFSYAKSGQRIATVKSTPFAVSSQQLEAVTSILRERGPILQARPIRNPAVAILYTDIVAGERARQLFENIMHQRLERFGTTPAVRAGLRGGRDDGLPLGAPAGQDEADGAGGRLDDGAGGSGRCGRPRDGAHRLPPRALSGAGGAGQPLHDELQGRSADSVGAGLLPVGQAERARPRPAASTCPVSDIGLGDRLPGPRRPAGVTALGALPPPSAPERSRATRVARLLYFRATRIPPAASDTVYSEMRP